MEKGAPTHEELQTDYERLREFICQSQLRGDQHPEGVDYNLWVVDRACGLHKPVRVIAVETLPKWTWYFRVAE